MTHLRRLKDCSHASNARVALIIYFCALRETSILYTAGKRELLSRKWRRAKRFRRYHRLLGAVPGRGLAPRRHGVVLTAASRPGATAVAVPLLAMLGIQVSSE